MLAVGFISSDISREDREEWAETFDRTQHNSNPTDWHGLQIYSINNSGVDYWLRSYLGTRGEETLIGYNAKSAYAEPTVAVNYAKQFNDITTQLQSINTNLSTLSTSVASSPSSSSSSSSDPVVIPQDVPVITVCQNQSFSFVVGYYDDMPNGTSADGLVTVTNSNVGDKVVQLSGRISTKGTHSVVIHGRTFIIKVIDPPTTSSVNVILN